MIRRIVSAFRGDLNFSCLAQRRYSSLGTSNLLSRLSRSRHCCACFRLREVLVGSSLFHKRVHVTVTRDSRVCSGTHTLTCPFNGTLTLGTVKRICDCANELQRTNTTCRRSLELLSKVSKRSIRVHVLLIRLVSCGLHVQGMGNTSHCLTHLGLCPRSQLSPLRLTVHRVSGTSYRLFGNSLGTTDRYLTRVNRLRARLVPRVQRCLLVVSTHCLITAKRRRTTLATCGSFLRARCTQVGRGVCGRTLLRGTSLLIGVKGGRRTCKRCNGIFSCVGASFRGGCPGRVSQLYAHFRTSRLTCRGRHSHVMSVHFCLTNVAISMLFLVFLLILN